MKKILTAVAVALAGAFVLTGCSSEADMTSNNLSREAEDFKIDRRIVFFNGITDTYLLTIEGRCSIEAGTTGVANALEVTCKISEDGYKKHFLGLSDNVSYFVEQLESADVSAYYYKVFFRPESIVPDIDLETSN